jgi:hypothetical protein
VTCHCAILGSGGHYSWYSTMSKPICGASLKIVAHASLNEASFDNRYWSMS